MHELSIATAILELARRHVPPGAVLRGVSVRAGPQRGIDRLAMELAWQAATADQPGGPLDLKLELLPWELACPDCGRRWTDEDALAVCACGGARARPVGGDDLALLAIVVEDPPPAGGV